MPLRFFTNDLLHSIKVFKIDAKLVFGLVVGSGEQD
jgi:hypothetical protein